jgi:hypothetical protein
LYLLNRADPRHGHPPDDHQPRSHDGSKWPTVITIVLVLGCTTVLLLPGSNLNDALLGAGGMALIGNEVARRIIADAGPLPTVVVASAVAALGSVLIILGNGFSEAAMGAGVAGLVAGEIASRVFGGPRSGREV